MAFSLSGLLSRLGRAGLYPSAIQKTQQIRCYAARKGTREKALKKKRALKLKKAAQTVQEEKKKFMSSTSTGVLSTPESNLPPVPSNCDVYFSEFYKPKDYSISEAVDFHRENLDPTVLDDPSATIKILIELNMTAEKTTRVMKPWRTLLAYPHIFETGFRRRLLVFCNENLIQQAIDKGANAAGGIPLIKQIKKGEYDISQFDRVIGQAELVEEINSLRSKLKMLLPKVSNGTLLTDVIGAVPRFKYGIEYQCNISKTEQFFGWIETQIGTLNMDKKEIEDNFATLIKNVNSKRPSRPGDFIKYVWCLAPPSREKFKIGIEPYLETKSEKPSENEKVDEEKVASVAAA